MGSAEEKFIFEDLLQGLLEGTSSIFMSQSHAWQTRSESFVRKSTEVFDAGFHSPILYSEANSNNPASAVNKVNFRQEQSLRDRLALSRQ